MIEGVRLYREEGLSLRRQRQKKATDDPADRRADTDLLRRAMQETLATDPLSKKRRRKQRLGVV